MEAKIVLCDLGGTVVDVNHIAYVTQELGISNIILSGFTNGLTFNPKDKMFAALTKIDPTPVTVTHGSTPLPKIYADWMAGLYQDAEQTRTMILDKIDQFQREGFFASTYEYRVVRNAIEPMFTPEKLVKHQRGIEPMLQLLERIDRNKHTIVIVSNWDPHSYRLFLESDLGKRLLRLASHDHMIVSGYIGSNKPHTEFYQEVFKRYGDPKDTEYVFIDNELVNIKAARDHGILSLHYLGDHAQMEQSLIDQGILMPQ